MLKKPSSKLFAVLLGAVMAFSMMPLPASFADEEDYVTPNTTDTRYVLEYGETLSLHSDSAAIGGESAWLQNGTNSDIELTVIDSSNATVVNVNSQTGTSYAAVRHTVHSDIGDDTYEYFYLTLEPQKFTVTFMLQGVGETAFAEAGTASVATQHAASVPSTIAQSVTVDGKTYKLDGWYTDESCETAASLESVTADMTVYGHYIESNVIHFDINVPDGFSTEEKMTQPDDIGIEAGEAVTLPRLPNVGAQEYYAYFGGWNTAADGLGTAYNAGSTITGTGEDITLYAQWQCQIVFSANSGDGAPSSLTVVGAGPHTLPADVPTRTGYTFLGWSTNSSATEATYTAGGEITLSRLYTLLYAVWQQDEYTITYNLDGGTWPEGSTNHPETYTVDESYTLDNPEKDGYGFLGWTGTDLDEATLSAQIARGSTGNREYTANWKELDTYTVVVENIHAGDAISSNYPKVSEADNAASVSTIIVWMPTETDVLKAQAKVAEGTYAADGYDTCSGTFAAGQTYYGIGIVKVAAAGGDPATAIVKVAKTDTVAQVGEAVVAANGEDVIVAFAVTIPSITVTVEFGSGHEAFASAVAESEEFEGTGVSVSGSTLVYLAEKGADMWYDVTRPIRAALMTAESDEDAGERLMSPISYNMKPISEYSDYEAWEADYEENISDPEVAAPTEDVTLYVQWLKPTIVALSIEAPVCGTEVEVTESETGMSQTNGPAVTVTSGEAMLDDEYLLWVDLENEDDPYFNDTIEGGESYTALVYIGAAFGYYVDMDEVTVEGGEFVETGYSSPYAPKFIKVTAEHDPAEAVQENVVAATCEKAGSYDDVVYCAGCDEELSRETVTVEALGHDWGEWTVTKEATATEDGLRTRVCSRDASHVETEVIPASGEETVLEYTVAEGGDATWTKGSADGLVVTIKRSMDDDTCFAHFTGAFMDGTELTVGLDYTAVSGSTVITLAAATLEKLSAGTHTLKATFEDGDVSTTVTVKDSGSTPDESDDESDDDSGSGSGSGDKDKGDKIPATADDAPLGAALALAALAGGALGALLVVRRRV